MARNKRRKVNKNRLFILIGLVVFLLFLIVFVITSIFSFFTKPSTKDLENKKMEETRVSFLGVGDNLIHDTVYKDAQLQDGSYDFKKLYSNFKKDLKETDIAFINQETVLGGVELGLSGYPTFNSPKELATDLEAVGFDLVNLATNHCLDKSEQGIQNELDAFSQTDLIVDGVYTSQEAYDAIPTFKKKGITFSFLAYTYGTNGIVAPNGYNVSYFDEEQIRHEVKQAKKISDVVIVSAHWGDENTFKPNEFQKNYAQLFADCGVDVVIGTHPHTIQPVEWIQGKSGNKMLCVYSLGNFIGGMLTTDNAIGGEITFDFVKEKNKVSVQNVKWIPTFIHFEGNQGNIFEDRSQYKAYKVSQYSDELAKKHVLNGYNGNVVSMDYIRSKTEEVIDKEFLE